MPIPTRRLLSVGIIFALVIALPLFIYAITNQKFLINQKAATASIPLNINESFTGSGALDSTKWNWSGTNGESAALENNQLKMTVSSGRSSAGGNNTVAQALVNSQIPTITGDFDVSVDLTGIETTAGWEALKFAPDPSIEIRRVKVGTAETLEVWTSTTNSPDTTTKNASVNIPQGQASVRVRLQRTPTEVIASYDFGSGMTQLYSSTMQGLFIDEALPRLTVENLGPDYPPVTVFFDNYSATANMVIQETPAPSPTATPAACNGTCRTNYDCASGLVCTSGNCRNPSCAINSDCICNETAITPSPSPSPSPIPSPTATPECQPRPSCLDSTPRCLLPVPAGGWCPVSANLNIKVMVKLAGVTGTNANGAKMTLRFQNPQIDSTSSFITLQSIGGDIYEGIITLGANSGLPAANNYFVYAKGEKHLANKYCFAQGQTQKCSTVLGNISIPASGDLVLDFTGIPLEPGDVYPQDGSANTDDFARITALLSKPHSALTTQDLLVGDLNYDGYINISDAYLMRKTLETRYDEN